MPSVLIIDDARFLQNVLKRIFSSNGYEIAGVADNVDEGLIKYKETRPDLVTIDLVIPNKSGIQGIKEIMEYDNDAKILICSALGQETLLREAIDMGASDYIVKPFKKEKLIEVANKILHKKT